MQKIAAGDTDQIGTLYERYYKMLFGYFFKLTKNQEMSEDLVNDVFLKILHSKNKYRGEGIFRVWMFRIAHNIFVDTYNRNKKLVVKEISVMKEETTEDSFRFIEQKENESMIHRALLKLNEKDREVIVMSKLDELKYREVAEILNCSEEAVKVRTFRALKNLKDILQRMQN